MPPGSSSSSSGPPKDSGPPSTGSSTSHTGLRNRLAHVLPLHRRATFHVRLQIHQLSALPFTYGQFAARWRFRDINADAIPKQNRLTRKAVAATSKSSVAVNEHGLGAISPTQSEYPPDIKGKSVAANGYESEPEPIQTRKSDDYSRSNDGHGHAHASQPAHVPEGVKDAMFTVDSKGATPFAHLRDYTVQWEQSIDTAVAMSIDRETGELIPNQLKIVIVQRDENVNDPTAIVKQPTGNVVFNLAEYADAGPVTRKYLLRNSRTNAVLKATLHVEWMAGEKQYRPAPLKKSEILAGISGLLSTILHESEELHIKHTGGLFSGSSIIPYAEDMSFHPVRSINERTRSTRATPSPSSSSLTVVGPVIDVDHTERVVESIFNPFPSSSETQNPFTYYTPRNLGLRGKSTTLQNGMLAVPPKDGLNSVHHMGTQEQIATAQGKVDPKSRPSLGNPTPLRSQTAGPSVGASTSKSRPQSRQSRDSRKASLDLDRRSIAISFKSESGENEGSVESHSGHGHGSQSDHSSSAAKRSNSTGSTPPTRRTGWFKRMITPRSNTTSAASSVSTKSSNIDEPLSTRTSSYTDLTHSTSSSTPLESCARPTTPALTMGTSSGAPSRSRTPEPYIGSLMTNGGGMSTIRPNKPRRSHEATVTFQ
ncbi:hypothetical protein BKA62DRAFT_685712 [Auriculariales sp. MPI-PUGE-AT-0066]|nr:hypothetical protein BKA62DRAFT_685712 [Auriculariales sp. MPI-PUGE-AT-0066]